MYKAYIIAETIILHGYHLKCHVVNNSKHEIHDLTESDLHQQLHKKIVIPQWEFLEKNAFSSWTEKISGIKIGFPPVPIQIFFFFFCRGRGAMPWACRGSPGQGWNPRHCIDLSHSHDHAGSLTARPSKNSSPGLSLHCNVFSLFSCPFNLYFTSVCSRDFGLVYLPEFVGTFLFFS